jgi:uncharacterized protein YodC (DUF2158 family)
MKVEEIKFKKGDCVSLIGGGPRLTVSDYTYYAYGNDTLAVDGRVSCIWFDKDDRIQEARISQDLLSLVGF